jgi:hypothetical protein
LNYLQEAFLWLSFYDFTIFKVRSSLNVMRVPLSSGQHIASSMTVAADVFVPFMFNCQPQLLEISAPFASALGEVKIVHDNDFERRARRAEMYVHSRLVMQHRSQISSAGMRARLKYCSTTIQLSASKKSF